MYKKNIEKLYKVFKENTLILSIVSFCLTLIIVIWVGLFYKLQAEKNGEIQEAIKITSSLTSAFEEHTIRTIKGADQMLSYVKNEYEEHGKATNVMSVVKSGSLLGDKQLVLLSIADENGDLQISNQNPFVFSNISDREHFKVHLNNSYKNVTNIETGNLYISKPVLGRSSGKWSIQLTKRLNYNDGSFAGVAVASIDPLYFTDFYKQIDLGDDSAIGIVDKDGTIYGLELENLKNSDESTKKLIGENLYKVNNELMEKLKKDSGSFIISSLDSEKGHERIYSYRKIKDFPYIIFIGISVEKALMEYHQIEKETIISASIASLLIILACVILCLMVIKNKKSEKLDSYLATHDSLTNIPNRYLLEKSLAKVINHKECNAILLFVDIDNFKIINDTFGHGTGDLALKKVANIFKQNLREQDILARLGGDEFAIILTCTNLEDGAKVAEELRQLVENIKINIDDFGDTINNIDSKNHLSLTASFGMVPINGTLGNNLDAKQLLVYADTALYAAKDSGKNRTITIQSIEEKDKMSRTNRTLRNVKESLNNNGFVTLYQPIINIKTKEISHYEALIRMIDKQGNLVPPGVFIPLAEKFGLMSQIDKWILDDVLKKMKCKPDIKVFLNMSGTSLGDIALLQFIEKKINESGINPNRIGFEITETSAVQDLIKSEYWICRLKGLGCKFALDDFGIGFSSFSYLSQLPIDYLKIDGSFVKNLDKDNKQRHLIQAVNAVAHSLGKETIAEFVENEKILNILEELEVDHAQGYYFGKPEILE
jgi:diguanylate cyclase (GGDEF)-like protein